MKTPVETPVEFDWNFDAVPDGELVACCYWEYARESRLIRDLRQKCAQARRESGSADSLIPNVAGNIWHPNHSVEVFLRGIVLHCSPDLWANAAPPKPCGQPPDFVPSLTSSLPAAWQSLPEHERTFRARIFEKGMTPYLAFRRGRLRDAQAIVRTVMEQRKAALNPQIDPLQVSWIAMHSPLTADARFEWTDRADRLPGGFLYPDGTEVTVVKIDWAHCTDKEIGEWVAKHRPPSIREPKDKGGHKRGDWRAAVEGLGLLRLRHHYTVEETLALIAAHLTPEQRKKTKFLEPGECNRQAEEAETDFHHLFPFLDPAEKPLSWPLK